MITDPLFYRLFQTNPETFFMVLGMSAEAAEKMAARYNYAALELKETAQRLDGLFRPKEPGLPLYFVEVQFYRSPAVFADLLAKAYTYLKQNDPGQAFRAVVLFGSRAFEPRELGPYQALLDARQLERHYLDEVPEIANAPLGLSIVYLIREREEQAAAHARELIQRVKREIADEAIRADVIELIETVIIYKLPKMSREEIQAMLQVHDIRETKVYQEAREEGFLEGIGKGLEQGLEKGIEKGIDEERHRQHQEKIRSIAKLAALKLSAQDIADVLGLDIEVVREELARRRP